MSAAPPRPPQVTLVAWLVMIGSAGTVLGAYVRLASLGDLETREAVSEFLSQSPGSQLGIGVDTTLDLIRALTLVAAACATAAVILGREVLGRSHSARIGLSVLAVPLLLTGSTTGGFLSAVVASAVVVLWLGPSRDWFNGVTPPRAPAPGAQAGRAPWPPPLSSPGVDVPSVSAAAGAPTTPPPYLDRLPTQPRPPAVAWAVGLTWAASGLVAVAVTAAVLVVALDPGSFFDQVHRQEPDLDAQGVSDTMIAASVFVMCGALLVWCVVASVVAALLWRRHRWARLALLVSSGCAGGVLLVASLAQLFLAVPLVAAVATFVLLRRPEVDRWLPR